MRGLTEEEEHRRVIALFPAPLQALIEAELAAGNRIIHAGAGHPAPPVGDQVMFAGDLRTIGEGLPSGLRLHVRSSSMHFQEVTDEQGFFWVLSSPHPPPPEPDMNAIRDRANFSPEPVHSHKPVFAHDTVEMDVRGEMLILHEADRRTDIIWTWNKGNHLYRSSLSAWWYPAERRSQPMTDKEKEQVLGRFMTYARTHISANIELRD